MLPSLRFGRRPSTPCHSSPFLTPSTLDLLAASRPTAYQAALAPASPPTAGRQAAARSVTTIDLALLLVGPPYHSLN